MQVRTGRTKQTRRGVPSRAPSALRLLLMPIARAPQKVKSLSLLNFSANTTLAKCTDTISEQKKRIKEICIKYSGPNSLPTPKRAHRLKSYWWFLASGYLSFGWLLRVPDCIKHPYRAKFKSKASAYCSFLWLDRKHFVTIILSCRKGGQERLSG